MVFLSLILQRGGSTHARCASGLRLAARATQNPVSENDQGAAHDEGEDEGNEPLGYALHVVFEVADACLGWFATRGRRARGGCRLLFFESGLPVH